MRKTGRLGSIMPFIAALCAAFPVCCGITGGQAAWAEAAYQWAWMKGSNLCNQEGIYGTLGVAAANNTPGARYGAASWSDPTGALWLFGGYGFDGETNYGHLNDLWKYDRATGNWAWMKGASTADQSGIYGTLGVPEADNTPSARSSAITWTDSSGSLWLFGGEVADCMTGFKNDLWKYDPSTGNWAWMKGSRECFEFGNYGTPGIPSEDNTPGARTDAVSWTDSEGMLWLFGGYGLGEWDTGYLNDLWKFDPDSGNWTWMGGAYNTFAEAEYGVMGTPAPENTPGNLVNASAWTDGEGMLWLMGGKYRNPEGQFGLTNALWKYDPASGNWTWMKGSPLGNQTGVHGTLGTAEAANTPGGRVGAVAWTDSAGMLWLFGGYGPDGGYMGGFNDLWKYDPTTGNWAWMGGAQSANESGTYGVFRVPAADNMPGARGKAVAWTDPAGAAWLFGGSGIVGPGSFNDLWRLVAPDTNPPTGSILINNNQSVTNKLDVTLNLTWSDGGGSGVVRMRFSNDGRTWSAWEPLKSNKAWTLAEGEGFRTVRAQFRDLAGNNSAIYSDYIRVDTLPPTGSVLINNNQSLTNDPNVTLNLSWDDAGGTGVARMRFSNDGRTWSAWEPLAATKAWTLPGGEGYRTVRVMFRDRAGNNSIAYNDYIRLDSIPPTGTIFINNNLSATTDPNVTLNLTWSDGAGSGVTRMRFSMDGKTWTAWEALAANKPWTLPDMPGHHTVRVTYRDAAGNISAACTDYIRLDAP